MAAQPTSYVLAGACLKNNLLIGCALERTECCLVDNDNSNCSSISSSDEHNFGNQTDDNVVVFRSSRQLSLTERPVGGVCLQRTSTVPIGECPSDGFCASTKSSCTNPDEFVTAYNNSSESCGLEQSQTTTPNDNNNIIINDDDNNNNNNTIPTQYGACLSNQTDTDATITTSIKFECLWSRRDCRSDWWLLPFSTTLANSDPSASSSSSSCGCDQVQTGACVSAEGLYCAVSAEGCDDASVFVPYHDLQVDCRLCPPLATPRPSPNPTLPLPTPSPTPNPTYTPLPPYSPRPTAPTSTTILVVEPTTTINNNGSSALLIGVVTGIVGVLMISLVVGIVWLVTKREAEWNKQHFAEQDSHDEEQEEDGQRRFKEKNSGDGAAGATAAAHDSYEFQRNPHELT